MPVELLLLKPGRYRVTVKDEAGRVLQEEFLDVEGSRAVVTVEVPGRQLCRIAAN